MKRGLAPDVGDRLNDDDIDARLVVRIQRHDGDAFHKLYDRYHGRLACFLTKLTPNPAEAEEVINDTLWSVWARASEFRDGSRVSTWIMRMACRHSLRVLSRFPYRAHTMRGAEENCESTTPAALRVERERQSLQRAFTQLPLKHRLLLELTYSLGHSCAEIAEILEWPDAVVKVHMFHARRRLQKILVQGNGIALNATYGSCAVQREKN